MEGASGTVFKMEQCIRAKLLAVGANAREKAVTAQEAHFDIEEENWLRYVAGGLFSVVKKTKGKRYYTPAYNQETSFKRSRKDLIVKE